MARPSAGDPVLASDVTVPRYIVKSGSEIVNNSATLQNDNDLFVDLEVGVYWVDLIVHYTTTTTADFSGAWTTTGTITTLGRMVLGPSQGMSDVTDMTVRMQGLAIGTASALGGNASSSNICMERLLVDVTVAGRLQWQWAQRVATVTDTTCTGASRMLITECEAV